MTDNKTPKATAHKGLGPLSAFRLTNGVINASDEDLGHSSESCERWAVGSALAVIVGLVLEVGIAFTHPPFDSFGEHWGSAIADILVALGVAGEVLFSRMGSSRQNELTRRSSDKLANAEFLAMDAQRKLAEAQTKLADANDRLVKAETEQSWPGGFRQRDKWCFCLKAA